jgi:DNA-binding MarR family transcriptional regulator
MLRAGVRTEADVVDRGTAGRSGRALEWTFLTNHGHVLLALARDPQSRLRDVAALVGITERAVQAIVADLEAEGYLTRIRVGRRNVYRLHPQRRFRHPAESRHRIGELLDLFTERPSAADGQGADVSG